MIKEVLRLIEALTKRVSILEAKDASRFGIIAVSDGVTAPATYPTYALIYVDTADGDLKIKFGDGTTKTIVTDT